jgi:hypothetical protein
MDTIQELTPIENEQTFPNFEKDSQVITPLDSRPCGLILTGVPISPAQMPKAPLDDDISEIEIRTELATLTDKIEPKLQDYEDKTATEDGLKKSTTRLDVRRDKSQKLKVTASIFIETLLI